MDRIDAMKVFVAAVEEGSLAAAARRLKRSPAAVTRAITFLEAHVGVELLHRTTRALKLSEAGARYVAACRRVLADLEEADTLAAGEGSAARGLLTVSAPPISGEEILRPILDEFLDAYSAVSARLMLLDRPVQLIEESVDVALRVGQLPDSAMVATRVGGEVRRVLVASPAYLADNPAITEPADLMRHRIIAFSNFGLESWTFTPPPGSAIPRMVRLTPRLIVNSVRAALASAIEGHGVTRLYSYHVADAVRDGRLELVLPQAEHAPLPVHLLTPEGRNLAPKVRAFLDFAAPRLRDRFASLAVDARTLGKQGPPPGAQ
jgi:DNA-binding transcriptional LysR family regulator